MRYPWSYPLAALSAIAVLEACTAVSPSSGLSTPLAAQGTPETTAIGLAVYFSKDNQHPEQVVVDSVNGATTEIATAMYSFTYQPIWDAYIAAVQQRHVSLTLVVDRTELHGANNTNMRKGVLALCQLGKDVREDTFSGLMHNKLTVIDSRRVLGGSFNYTTAATRSNDENLTVIDSPKYAAIYRAHVLETYGSAKSACNDPGPASPVPSPGLEGVEDGE